MKISSAARLLPKWQNLLLAVISSFLLILSFPDFDLYFLAWVGFLPLILAIYRERESPVRAFVAGWVFGTIFFIGTVWWLTYSPINYGGFPPWLAYTLLVGVCSYVGIFPALFAAVSAYLFKKFDLRAFLFLPFVWVVTEFLRYWLSGNSWNAVGYSQAFGSFLLPLAAIGGVYLVGFAVVSLNAFLASLLFSVSIYVSQSKKERAYAAVVVPAAVFVLLFMLVGWKADTGSAARSGESKGTQTFIIVQVNVPMAGLDLSKWERLRERHVQMAETELAQLRDSGNTQPVTVVFPESPMNFMYKEDREFNKFINGFARRNNMNVLFNSAEPDPETHTYFNSAVMVYGNGGEPVQYDKIYLVPFGEFVPGPLRAVIPGLIGSFASGREYDVFDIDGTKAAVMLCYESNFGQLSRALVAGGADYLIEMTNDGYLGETPVLRQHLTSAVFRAVETNRPVMRATNVGITAFVTPRGEVLDAAPIYAEATRVWQVSASAGDRTFYVRFGDWIAWLSLFVVVGTCVLGRFKHKNISE
jgi:apolipoprotein N-acyltransferase